MAGCRGAQVQRDRRRILELVTDVQSVLRLGDVAVHRLSVRFVLLHRRGDLLVERLQLLELAGLRGPFVDDGDVGVGHGHFGSPMV